METKIQSILNQTGTKTGKIQQLLLLGLTRRQVADLVTNGNYGFVQNIYAKMNFEQHITRIANQFSTVPFNKKFGVEFEAYNVRMHDLKRALNNEGINCEVEGYNHTTSRHWKLVTDSSIRGEKAFELVSPILYGQAGLEEVERVCTVLNQMNAKVNRFCGTHVHIDASGFSMDVWKRIYINYARIESVIDDFMPLSRKNNVYCKTFTSINNLESKIKRATTLADIARNVFGNSRYYKVNPLSYSRHKTCEFRQHSGTVEYEKISNWIIFLHNLVDFSKTNYITDTTLDGLSKFNDKSTVNYYKLRTNKFSA